MNVINIARYTLGFVWIYQGIFPKILTIAPMEMQLSGSIGLPIEWTYWFIKLAGIGEVIFGLLLILYYQSKALQVLNLFALVGLIGFTAVLQPQMLIEAFNPITTNLPCIVLGTYLYLHAKQGDALPDK